MHEIIVIAKKELKRFFTDKRVLASLVLPGVLIFVLYSLMGSFIGDVFMPSEEHEYVVFVENESETFDAYMAVNGFCYTKTENVDAKQAEDMLKKNEIDLWVSFSEGFDGDGQNKNVILKYNSTSTNSLLIYEALYAAYSQNSIENITYKYTVNAGESGDVEIPDVATEQDLTKMMVTMIVPFILMVFLVTGCMGVATESIAGEKERGTIATLLVTPVKREYIALGKIVALTITALFSSFISFIGLIASFPKLIAMSGDLSVDLSSYGVGTYVGVLGIILISVMIFTMLISVLSTFAKSVKEASQLVTPVMIVVMLAGVTSMIGGGTATSSPVLYLIPVYNCVQCLTMLFSGEFYGLCYLITVLINAIFVALGIFALAKMFGNEKVMLNK